MAGEHRFRNLIVSLAGLIAATAVVVTNLNTILSTTAKWLRPYLNPKAILSFDLDPDLSIAPRVFVADPGNETQALGSDVAQPNRRAVLKVSANVFYQIGWQGAGLKAGAVSHYLAVKGESRFRLMRAGMEQDLVVLSLRQSDIDRPELAPTEPSAKLILSARALRAVGDPSLLGTTGALPELDRDAAVVGLFETGTTDCARRLFFIPSPSGTAPAVVGCLGAGIPGWLADVITALDSRDTHWLDSLLGEDAAAIRKYASPARQGSPTETQLRRAMERLVATPEFWIQYQVRVLSGYAQATEAAHQIGLTSERGRLLIFNQLVMGGPVSVDRGIRSYAAEYPEGAPRRPDNEVARIQALGAILKAQGGFEARRIDTIVSGKGSVRGIAFDLDQLGVSDTH